MNAYEKMHQALLALDAWAKVVKNNPKDKTAIECAEFVEETIKAALAEPPRNCDVGAAEEQIGRHNEYCRHLKDTAARYNFNLEICDDCRYCFAKWLQMPYEEGGEK